MKCSPEDALTAVFFLKLLTQPLVFTVIVLTLALTVFRSGLKTALSDLASTFTEIKVGDISFKFQQLEERVAVAESKAEDARDLLDELTVDRNELDQLVASDVATASARDLDETASRMRSVAAALDDNHVGSYAGDLTPGTAEEKVFAAAVVARSRPIAHFAKPLSDQIAFLAGDGDLQGFRLKTAYRLVMALETILRTDNKLSQRKLDGALRQQVKAALEALQANPRCVSDDEANGSKGIGARIRRTLALT